MTHYLQSLIKAFQRLPMTALMTAPFKTTMKAAMLLVAALLLLPQAAYADTGEEEWEDYNPHYPLWDAQWGYGYQDNGLQYEYNNGDPYISWKTIVFDGDGNHEGFYNDESREWGLGVYIKVGNGEEYYVGHLGCNDGGYSRRLNRYGTWYDNDLNQARDSIPWEYGGHWHFEYGEGYYGGGKVTWIKPRWYIPLEYRNTNITLSLTGKWYKWTTSNGHWSVSCTAKTPCSYTFNVRSIAWNGNYSVSEDGTVTIPYSFGGSCNTDGHTHLCTSINGRYSSQIGIKSLSGYSAGSYSFKLSDIGMSFTSSFTIQPYHEFTHDHDKDADNGRKNYTSAAATRTFLPLPKAIIENAAFSQQNKNVVLTWKASNTNYGSGKWAIYRNGQKIAVVDRNTTTYTDTSIPYEQKLTYEVYFLMSNWDENTKLNELKSNAFDRETNRTMPVKHFNAESKSDRIVLTWGSDGYPADWGNKFKIYVDNELVYTITPANEQNSFRWEHRSTNTHTDRVNGQEGATFYTEERLNGAEPHNYRVEGVIGDKVFDKDSAMYRGIGSGTTFYSLDASKNAYAGQAKLAWHVDRQGSTKAQTYIVERQIAEQKKDVWTTLTRFSSTDDYLFYTDDTPLPGVCYKYHVKVQDFRSDGAILEDDITDIGFAQASGTISGRITYGTTGMAVQGVDVVAAPIGNDVAKHYHSIRFTGTNGELKWTYPSATYANETFNTKPWSIQMWVNPDSLKVCRIADFIGMSAEGAIQVKATDTTYTFPDVKLNANEYSHLTLTRSGNTLTAYVTTTGEDGLPLVQSAQVTLTGNLDLNNANQFSLGGFTGYVDEFRLWTKCLTQEEIKENYNHLLVGDEANLETYWSFDEGLSTRFFDYSREGTVYNSHHGIIGGNAESSDYFPSQLALRATTDNSGNYIIRGVPFSGEGTTYAVVPTLGIHSFNPTQQLRYVSANSLVHNGTDFDDVSSFPVSGTVYYAGTNYPVEGCNLYVDGQICSKDGEVIETNAYGQFTISVPIGDHFIQVKKQGHVFVNEGRYPAQAGKYVNFDREVKNLTFYDSTLVNFTGRVAGGDIEGDKPVGFGQSKNNIGMATLTLIPRNIENTNYLINAVLPTEGTVIEYEPNPDRVALVSASPNTIHSEAWRGYGNADNCQKFFIRTDSATGEFSALLPPLDYIVSSIHVASAPELDTKIMESPIAVDMTNPQMTHKDSVRGSDSTMQYYEYHAMLRQTYHSEPTFSVVQRGHEDGSFGIDSIEIEDALGTLKLNDIHHIDTVTGDLVYTYGYPLFVMGDPYIFDIEGYEQYVNKDGAEDVSDRVPMADMVVTIENALSDDQAVCGENNTIDSIPGSVYELKSNQLALDSLGKASYTWHAGIPNITSPFARTINIYYDINGRHNNWSMNPMEAIVLGDMPTGTNFVTTGPDRVQMILRDPPGSGSSASWETGSNTSITEVSTKNISTDNSLKIKESVGIETEIGTGIGVMTIIKTKVTADDTQGLSVSAEWKNSRSYSTTISTSKTISTSSDSDYDGAEGDVFIGTSTNILFGKVRNVALYRNTDDTTKAHVDLHDAISSGLQFTTCFSYTQKYIEKSLIPNLRMLRDACLVYAADTSSVTNTGETPIYVTSLLPDSPDYGSEGTYRMIAPENAVQSFCDTILYFNNQIANWENQLALNEKEKVGAYDHRSELENEGLMTNYSFDAGTSIEISKTNETSTSESSESSWSVMATLGSSAGFEVNGCGMSYEFEDKTGGGETSETEQEQSASTTFSFSLIDGDEGDAISVDVYSGQGLFGSPIFRTRGGQTSNPYEGEVQTRYYQPGTTIMEATMQIEMPNIEVVQPILTDVTSGTAANFELHLMNQSETNANCTFKLYVADASNPHGAQIIVDGMPLTGEGRLIKVPYGETLVKSLQLRQSDASILDYEDIELVLASKNQGRIKDVALISAHFVPSSSPVTLAVNTNTVNTHTDTVLVLTMKDFDRNFYNLKAFRMQYKQQGGKWTDLHEYVLNGEQLSSIQQQLPDSMPVVYRLSMKNAMSWPDGTYTFRIVSVSTYGAEEVYVYSNEQTVIKDTSYPRPLGQAQPADGVLEIGDELSITYNMPFLSGSLTPENFLVTGVLNGAQVEHLTALRTYADDTQATARTEANINLSGKDYSLDAWLNIRSAGTLFRHGSGKQTMEIRTDEAGHLMVAFFGDSVVYTSDSIVPRDKWVFFTLSRKVSNNKGKINVAVAEGSKDTRYLFTDKEVPLYNGNGPLSVGLGAEASVHEVLLWDEARDVETAVSQHSVTKSPSTRHLIGYWKMNEGEGKSIRDYARNRHMVMRDESWYLNNINKAVMLNGGQYFSASTANVPPLPQDDYAMEMWLQGGTQADTAQLMQLGDISLWLDPNGQLHLQSGTSQWAMTNHPSPITNSDWHHVMLNVRRYGTAAVYIDGERALTVSASAIGDFASDSLFVGVRRTHIAETDTTVAYYRYDRHFAGAVDEIRLWKTTIASDMLASKRKLRLNGDEPGLLLYYPLEKKGLDEFNQIVTSGTLEELTSHGSAATITNNQSPITNQYTNNAPALKEKPTQTNVAFSFTASDTKIVIDIDEEPALVDGCTLNFTVRDVRSVNGNNSLPATWSAFIHRNELAWQEAELTVVKKVDETVSFTAAIINRSGTPQRWSLSELPASLTASSISGMLNPLEKATITFRCHETAPLGKHERTIYAMGSNGVPTPLTLHVSVTGEIPDWSVNPADYETSMNVISQLDFFGHISDDEDDILAAFIGDECRGVTKSEYKDRYDGYYQTLTIYGTPEDEGKTVTFQAYRASTGVYYTLVTPDRTIKYNPLSIVGRYDEPVQLSVNDQIVQRTVLKQGWNWISLFTEADDMNPQTVFGEIADDVEVLKGRNDSIGWLLRTDTGWYGNMKPLLCRRSYKVKMKQERELVLIGRGINPATHTVLIHSDWGWPGYYGLHRISLANAMAGADPQNGDIIRTQSAAAYFDDYEWVGSLQALEPGQGYAYYSVTNEEKWFAYPSSSVAAAPRRAFSNQPSAVSEADEDPTYTGRFAPDNEYGYPYNMILVGQVLLDNQPAANAEIGIFDGDECRSVGYTDAQGLLLMLVAGEDEAVLGCKMALGDQVYETVETLHYVTDAIVGTPDMPHLIRFGEGQGIEDVQGDNVRSTKVRKVLIDGILYILRNGKTYTATGQEVR